MAKLLKDVINFSDRLGKILIAGEEGSGKTLLSTAIAVTKMLRGMEDCWRSYEQVEEYNKMGYNFSTNYEHLVFANHKINCSGTKIPAFDSHAVDPFKLGLHCDNYDFDFFPPGSTFFITEAHIPFDAYMWDYVRPEVRAYWTTSRQADISLVMDTNRPKQIVNFIRDLCNIILHCYKKVEEIKDLKGIVVGHKFFILDFRSPRAYERFLETNKEENCEKYELIVHKCYYENYDSKMCRYLHLKGRINDDFYINHIPKVETIEDVETLSGSFGFFAPDGYYVKKSDKLKKKEEQKEENLDDDIVF